MGLYQTKNLLHTKGDYYQSKETSTGWEKMLTNYNPNKRTIFRTKEK